MKAVNTDKELLIAIKKERNIHPSYYDLIVMGILVRLAMMYPLIYLKSMKPQLVKISIRTADMIYRKGQPVLAGGSGAGCSATVVYGHLLNRMKKGEFIGMLVVATGALLSPPYPLQIPCIAHAVSIEYGGKQ